MNIASPAVPHVFVGLIARHVLTVATSQTLQGLAVAGRNLGFKLTVGIEETGGIALARNLLTETFFDRTEAGWFLSFDDDVARLRGPDLHRMMGHGVGVVGAPVPGRAIQPDSVARALTAGDLQRAVASPNAFERYLGIHENLSPLLLTFLPEGPVWKGADLIEVESTSAGCLLISRDAMGRMIEKHGRFAYNSRKPPRVWNFTEEIPDDSYQFCKHWRELGGKVYVDAHTKLTHRGVVDFATRPLSALLGGP